MTPTLQGSELKTGGGFQKHICGFNTFFMKENLP